MPHIVVEVVSAGGEERDYVEKKEEYLRVGIREYWLLDPEARKVLIFSRGGDGWEELAVTPGAVYKTRFLPGLEVRLEGPLGVEESSPKN